MNHNRFSLLTTSYFLLSIQATTFTQVLDADIEASDDKAITAMGILNTIETILNVVEEKKEVSQNYVSKNIDPFPLQSYLPTCYAKILSQALARITQYLHLTLWTLASLHIGCTAYPEQSAITYQYRFFGL